MSKKHPSNTPLDEWSDGWLRLECIDIFVNRFNKDVVESFDEAATMSREQMKDFARKYSNRHGDAAS